jgi:tRNA threonylcarbamoyl adenosine modification protein YjeE
MMKKKSLEWLNCSESELPSRIQEVAPVLTSSGTLILLEGKMGAGKSAFARAVLVQLTGQADTKGSPSFPLVQEYVSSRGVPIFHIDLYRLKSEDELIDSGIAEQIDSDEALVMVEWASLFPDFFSHYDSPRSKKKVIHVLIEDGEGETRNYRVTGSGL